jgi:hypothetical protein
MQKLKFMINSWVIALRKGMAESGDNNASFLAKLQELQRADDFSQEITNELTIQMWKEGYIIGPQNPKNIQLIGKIYGQKFLVDNYKEIGTYITRLRGIHQSLLRKFNDMAMHAGLKTIKDHISNEVIDEEFNLHLEDFVDIISFGRIASIEPDKYASKSKLDKRLRE